MAFASTAEVQRTFASFSESRSWLTRQGTLGRPELESILEACAFLGTHPRDCAPRVLNGEGVFGDLPPEARREANLLLRECDESSSVEDCRTRASEMRYIRDLPVGRIRPQPEKMLEDQQTTFTAFIVRTDAVSVPGQTGFTDPANAGSSGDGDSTAGDGSLVSYTPETCFELDPGEAFELLSDERQCPERLRSDDTVFAPEWTLIPREPGQQELKLEVILMHDGEELDRKPMRPYPISIQVEPAPTLAQKIRAWLTDWTGVAEDAKVFILALEALLAAIMGLGIWGWLKKRRKGSA